VEKMFPVGGLLEMVVPSLNVERQGASFEKNHSQKYGLGSVRWRYQFICGFCELAWNIDSE